MAQLIKVLLDWLVATSTAIGWILFGKYHAAGVCKRLSVSLYLMKLIFKYEIALYYTQIYYFQLCHSPVPKPAQKEIIKLQIFIRKPYVSIAANRNFKQRAVKINVWECKEVDYELLLLQMKNKGEW